MPNYKAEVKYPGADGRTKTWTSSFEAEDMLDAGMLIIDEFQEDMDDKIYSVYIEKLIDQETPSQSV